MTIRYPNGKRYVPPTHKRKQTSSQQSVVAFGNRGATLEEELNDANDYYLTHHIAVIHKKPTPVQVVHVKYPSRSQALMTEAYYRAPSTTDYNGVGNGYYLDFEAKETKSKASFPLQNIHEHQVEHMRAVYKQSGIVFFVFHFRSLNRYFVQFFKEFYPFWKRMKNGGRKSITLQEIEETSIEITLGLAPRLPYLQAVQQYIKRER